MKRYIVTLTDAERAELGKLISSGKGAARRLAHARILLKADQGLPDERIAAEVEVGRATVERVRKRFVEEGLAASLDPRRPDNPREHKIDGEVEAHLVALACSCPTRGQGPLELAPPGRQADRAGIPARGLSRDGSPSLEANELAPWRKQEWVIPPEQCAEFVYHMEDVLDVYARPFDPKRPLVCLDELPKQLIGETRSPLPPLPGVPERIDYEYVRNGVANIFCVCEPLLGTRELLCHRASDPPGLGEAHQGPRRRPPSRRREDRPGARSTQHPLASIASTRPSSPPRPSGSADKLEIHHTPKHGSWLNIAEIELSVLSRQCLDRRIADLATLRQEVQAHQRYRDSLGTKVNWRFTTADARIKLKRLYPSSAGRHNMRLDALSRALCHPLGQMQSIGWADGRRWARVTC